MNSDKMIRRAGLVALITMVGACAHVDEPTQFPSSSAESESPAAFGDAYSPLCDVVPDAPADLALGEEDFTADEAAQAIVYLEERVGASLVALQLAAQDRPGETAAVFGANWETLFIGRSNALIALRGYLLRQEALSAPTEERPAANDAFCDFLKTAVAVD